MGSRRSDDGAQVGCNHPTSAVLVGRRLEAAIASFRTKREAANALDISTDQLTRYEKGVASPPLSVLTRLAHAKGISLDWLATGDGPMRAGEAVPPTAPTSSPGVVDEDLVDQIFEGVAEVYADAGVELRRGQIGRISARILCDLIRDFAPDEREAGMRGMFSQLRRQLLEAATRPAAVEETKRRA